MNNSPRYQELELAYNAASLALIRLENSLVSLRLHPAIMNLSTSQKLKIAKDAIDDNKNFRAGGAITS